MKKLLSMLMLVISMPVMAQSMYDGKSCEEWKNEFALRVSSLKAEVTSLKQKAKAGLDGVTNADVAAKKAELQKAQANLKVAKQAAALEKKGVSTHSKAQKKSFQLESQHAKQSQKLSKTQTKITKAEASVAKAEHP